MVRREAMDGKPPTKCAPHATANEWRAARRRHSTPDDVTGADDQRPSYVINRANKTAASPLPPR